MSNSQWYELFSDYFGVNLGADEHERWFSEIRERFRHITNDTICGAIRWASDTRNYRRPERSGKPTVMELIKMIGLHMHSSRTDQSIEPTKCDFCDNSGWIPWSMEIGDNREFTLDEYNLSITVAIPCGCSTGRRVFEANYGAGNKFHNDVVSAEAQLQVARQAGRQRIRVNKLKTALKGAV